MDAVPVQLVQMAEQAAVAHALDPNLVKAIITVESSWNPKVSRFEPNWTYFHFPREWASRLGITETTEKTLQALSIGLTQVMGTVAREQGFTGNLSDLFLPEVNLEYGCRKIKSLMRKYADEASVISSYNQGSPRKTEGGHFRNQIYVDKVSAELRKLRALK